MSSLPFVAYYGHHKCGTEWISGIIQAVSSKAGLRVARHSNIAGFGGDIVSLHAAAPFDVWCFTNARYPIVQALEVRGFHVMRDPRDIVVSGYFSHRNSHPLDGWPALTVHRDRLRSISKIDGLLVEMDFLRPIFEMMRQWEPLPLVREVRFEELIRNPVETFDAIFTHLQIVPMRIDEAALREIVDCQSFARMSGGRTPGEENAGHHFRKGVPGDWRNHFTPAHIEYFKERYNPLLLKLGYERDENWGLCEDNSIVAQSN